MFVSSSGSKKQHLSFTIDRFASFDNSKCKRFNSKLAVPGTEVIDAFTQDWRFEHNLLVPPVKHIVRVLNFIRSVAEKRAVLVVPLWTYASFWPLLKRGEEFAYFVKDYVSFENTSGILRLGKYKYSLLGSTKYKGGLIAFKICSWGFSSGDNLRYDRQFFKSRRGWANNSLAVRIKGKNSRSFLILMGTWSGFSSGGNQGQKKFKIFSNPTWGHGKDFLVVKIEDIKCMFSSLIGFRLRSSSGENRT